MFTEPAWLNVALHGAVHVAGAIGFVLGQYAWRRCKQLEGELKRQDAAWSYLVARLDQEQVIDKREFEDDDGQPYDARACPTCEGDGSFDEGHGKVPCPGCAGKGWVYP